MSDHVLPFKYRLRPDRLKTVSSKPISARLCLQAIEIELERGALKAREPLLGLLGAFLTRAADNAARRAMGARRTSRMRSDAIAAVILEIAGALPAGQRGVARLVRDRIKRRIEAMPQLGNVPTLATIRKVLRRGDFVARRNRSDP